MTLNKETVKHQRFSLGTTSISREALTYCEDNNIDYLELIVRHAMGDFGAVGHLDNAQLTRAERQHGAYVTENGLKLNAVAIFNKQGIVLSIYPSSQEEKIWIRTMLAEDKTYTMVLLPSDCFEMIIQPPV